MISRLSFASIDADDEWREQSFRLLGSATTYIRQVADSGGRAHRAQVSRYIDDFFGSDQWFLFDTRWAAAYPDLARSLLRYAAHWDPYEGVASE